MNERIKELAEQANAFARETVEYNRCDDFSEFTDRLYTVSREKFAELIVRECMMLVEGFESTQEVALDEYVDYEASAVLKEHFGVEE